MSRYSDCKVYVGDLGNSASKQEIEDAFKYYGPLRNVWVARNPPGFAFVEFEDSRDAEDAIRGLDGRRICGRKARVEKYGRTICGRRARVEMSNGKSGSGGRYRGPPPRSRGKPFHPDDRCYECGDRGHYARDCNRYRSSRRHRLRVCGRSRSRSRSRSRDRRSRSRSNTRSRSRSRNRSRSESRKRDRSRSRSHTNEKHSRSRSPHSKSRSRSRSVKENGNAKE